MSKLRTCLIGNSHLAAVKTAWDEHGSASFDPSFYGALNRDWSHLVVENGLLVASSSALAKQMQATGGATTIDPAQFDAFVLIGFSLSFHRFAKVYETHRLAEHVTRAGAPISPAGLRAAIRDFMDATVCLDVAKRIRSIFKGPILVCPIPNISAAARRLSQPEARKLNVLSDEAIFAPALAGVIASVLGELAAKHGFTVLPQPEQTVEDLVYTREDYAIGQTKAGEPDYLHANSAYGALVLDAIEVELERRLEAS